MPTTSKSRTTTKLPPTHPGEVLREEFLLPLDITSYRLAKDLGVPLPRINDLVLERRGVSPDTALRLARYFGTSAEFWMNLQAHYELETTRDEIERDLADVEPRTTDRPPEAISTVRVGAARKGDVMVRKVAKKKKKK